MSVDIHIYKFEKLSAAELEKVKYFNVSDDERLLGDGHNWDEFNPYSIMRFHLKDESIAKIPRDVFSEKMVKISQINREKMYKFLGFSDESIKSNKVHFRWMNGRKICYVDGEKEECISVDEEQRFMEVIEIPCLLVKFKELFDADDTTDFFCAKEARDRLIKLYAGFQTYNYEKVNNEMLAKAEIPFLVYERNRDKCFIYITD